jgi:hypothetical protein
MRKTAPNKLYQLLDYVENQKIKNDEDLNYFESFFAIGNQSELSKCLTKNIWEEYQDEKCNMNFSFKKCIYPGIIIRDTEQGVVAYSKDSYKKFHRLYEKIILRVHGGLDHKTD